MILKSRWRVIRHMQSILVLTHQGVAKTRIYQPTDPKKVVVQCLKKIRSSSLQNRKMKETRITAIFWRMKCLRTTRIIYTVNHLQKNKAQMYGGLTPRFQKRPIRKTKKMKRRKNRRSWIFRSNRWWTNSRIKSSGLSTYNFSRVSLRIWEYCRKTLSKYRTRRGRTLW